MSDQEAEAVAAAEVWWRQRSAQHLASLTLKEAFSAGYTAAKRMYHTPESEPEPEVKPITSGVDKNAIKRHG